MVGALEKLAAMPPLSLHVLDASKAKRLGGKTMVVPGVPEVLDAISEIPFGQSRTLLQIRQKLAVDAGADVACPFVTNKVWKLIAWSSQDPEAPDEVKTSPWWRVLKDGKPYEELPGGEVLQRKLLESEA